MTTTEVQPMPRQKPFQARVDDWIQHCFGPEIGTDKVERNHRFIEEALELVQSGGCTASEAHQLVDYVFNRPVGEMAQEIGGVMNTLAALCNAYGIDMNVAAETEIYRCWQKSDKIRAKQAAKPKHSPLPETVSAFRPPETAPEDEPVILATSGGWIGEAWMLVNEDTGQQEWWWVGRDPQGQERRADLHFRLLGWQPMPAHPDPTLDNDPIATVPVTQQEHGTDV